jgi:hypothetical protein
LKKQDNKKYKYKLPDFEKLKPNNLKKAASDFKKVCNKILEKDLKGEKND